MIMNIILKYYQIYNKTKQIRNVEYYQTFYIIIQKPLIPIIYINKDKNKQILVLNFFKDYIRTYFGK